MLLFVYYYCICLFAFNTGFAHLTAAMWARARAHITHQQNRCSIVHMLSGYRSMNSFANNYWQRITSNNITFLRMRMQTGVIHILFDDYQNRQNPLRSKVISAIIPVVDTKEPQVSPHVNNCFAALNRQWRSWTYASIPLRHIIIIIQMSWSISRAIILCNRSVIEQWDRTTGPDSSHMCSPYAMCGVQNGLRSSFVLLCILIRYFLVFPLLQTTIHHCFWMASCDHVASCLTVFFFLLLLPPVSFYASVIVWSCEVKYAIDHSAHTQQCLPNRPFTVLHIPTRSHLWCQIRCGITITAPIPFTHESQSMFRSRWISNIFFSITYLYESIE